VDTAPPAQQHLFAADLRLALEIASTATTTKRRKATSKLFGVWSDFCISHGNSCTLDHLLAEEKLTYLLVFALRYRQRGQKGRLVRAGTVRDALSAVGKGFTDLDQPDPRLNPQTGKLHPLLTDFCRSLERTDEPASRAYPVNVTILRKLPEALDRGHPIHGSLQEHTIQLTILAFFWLLRPAEYLHSPDSAESRSQAFRLQDATFTINGRVYSAVDAPLHDEKGELLSADAFANAISTASLTFSDQKNAVKGEQIGQCPTADPLLCPCKALGRIAHHLLTHGAKPSTPLYMFYNSHANHRKWSAVKPAFVMNALRHAAKACHSTTGIDPFLISARSLRPGGATALLCANVDKDAIMLLGRWKSDAMLRYLRIQAMTPGLSQRMLTHGSYTFHPQAFLNQEPPIEAPAAIHALLAHEELYNDSE
jgi:hypothetical protein